MIFEDPQSNYQKTVNNLLSKRDFDFDRQLEFKDILGSLFLGLAPAVIQGAIQGVNQRKFQRNKQIELLGQDAVDKVTYDLAEGKRKLNLPRIEAYDKDSPTFLRNEADAKIKSLYDDDLFNLGNKDAEKGFRIFKGEYPDVYKKIRREFENQIEDGIEQTKLNPFYTTKDYELTSDIRRGIANNTDIDPETLVSIIGDRISGKAAAEVEGQLSFKELFPKYDKFNEDVKAFENNQINQLEYLAVRDSSIFKSFLDTAPLGFDKAKADSLYPKIFDRFVEYEGDKVRGDKFSDFSMPDNVRELNIDGSPTGNTFSQILDEAKFKRLGLVGLQDGNLFIGEANREAVHQAVSEDMSVIAGYLIGESKNIADATGNPSALITDEQAIQLSRKIIETIGFVEINGKRGYKELFSGYVSDPDTVRDFIRLTAQTKDVSPLETAAKLYQVKVGESIVKSMPSVAKYTEINKVKERNILVSQLKSEEGRQLPEEQRDEILDRITAIDFQIDALRDMDAGVMQTMEDAEVADAAITQFLMNPPSDIKGYATFTNHDGNKQVINVSTKFTTEEGRRQLYSFYVQEYGANPDLRNLVNIAQEEEITEVTEDLDDVTLQEDSVDRRTTQQLRELNLTDFSAFTTNYLNQSRDYFYGTPGTASPFVEDLRKLSSSNLEYLSNLSDKEFVQNLDLPENVDLFGTPSELDLTRGSINDVIDAIRREKAIDNPDYFGFKPRKNLKPVEPSKDFYNKIKKKIGLVPDTRVVTEDLPRDDVDGTSVRPPLLAPSFDIFSDQQTGEEATNEAIDLAVKYGPDKETAKIFLNEIANVESQYGNAPNTFGKSDSKGHFQIDEIAFDEIQRRLRSDEEGQTLRDYNEKFMEDNGLDLRDISYDELDGRGLSAIFARLYLMRFTDKLPTNLRARAKYWKNNYNTKAGAGSVRRYIQVVKAK